MSVENKTIAVLMGGPGSEREVSLASGEGVMRALEERGAHVLEIDVQSEEFEIPDGIDLAFNVIHGTFGEDGALQKLLNSRRIPYTGAGASSSALAFDKGLSKKKFIEHGVPTPAFEFVPAGGDVLPAMQPPLVVKPPREGSSVGVHIVRDADGIVAALEDVAQHDEVALVEEFIGGKELTVGVLDGVPLPIVHIQPKSGFYDMKNKYPWLSGGEGSDYTCPADFDEDTTRLVQQAALGAHRALGIEIYSRVDVLLSEDAAPYVLEVNTIPGMTETSLLPKSAAAEGIDFPELCERIALLSMVMRQR